MSVRKPWSKTVCRTVLYDVVGHNKTTGMDTPNCHSVIYCCTAECLKNVPPHWQENCIWSGYKAKKIIIISICAYLFSWLVLHRPDPKEKDSHPTRAKKDASENTSVPSARGSGWAAIPGPTWDKNVSNATSTSIHTNRYSSEEGNRHSSHSLGQKIGPIYQKLTEFRLWLS